MLLRVKILIISVLCILPTIRVVGKGEQTTTNHVFISALDSTINHYLNMNFGGMRTWLEVMHKSIFDSTSLHIYKCLAADRDLFFATSLSSSNTSIKWLDTIKVSHAYLLTKDDDLGYYGQAISYWSMGMIEILDGNPEAKDHFKQSAIFFGRAKKEEARKNSEMMLTEVLIAEGQYAKANFYARQLLEEARQGNSTLAAGADPKMEYESLLLLMRSYNQLGINEQVERYRKLIEERKFYKSTSYSEIKFLQAKMNYLLSIGNYSEAMSMEERFLVLSLFNGIDVVSWRSYLLMARLMVETGDVYQAQKYLDRCRKLLNNHYISGGTEYPEAYLPLIEAKIAMLKNNYYQARRIIESSEMPHNITHLLSFADNYYSTYEKICVELKDYHQALIIMMEWEEVKKAMLRDRTIERTRDLELAFQNDTTIRRQNAILHKNAETISHMRTQYWLWFITALSIIMISVLIYIAFTNRRRRQDAKLAVERKKFLEREVEKQTLELKNQNDALNYQNQEVISSQTYARHIQKSIMPTPKTLDNFEEVKGSFLIYKAADMLSGDFYWFRRTNGGKIIICCADSWGRGVAGAMMTMVGITLMTDTIINNTNLTAADVMKIFDKHVLGIIPDMHTQEGINCSIAIIDNKNRKINLSLARQNAFISRDKNATVSKKFELLRGVTRRVGDVEEPFISREFTDLYLDYEEGDNLYLFTDGATNLFGGRQGKKLKTDGLQRMFELVEDEPIERRQFEMVRLLTQWHQNQPETDDITIIGLTLN